MRISIGGIAYLAAAWAELKNVPCLLEKRLPLKAELSVIVAELCTVTVLLELHITFLVVAESALLKV